MRRLPAADRRGRGRRRGARQRAGAAAGARVGRVRRPLREPDARARTPGRGRSARDGASVHAGTGRPQARGGGRRAPRDARRDAGRALHAAQPGRSGVRRARREARRLRPGGRRRSSRLVVGHRSGAQGTWAPRHRDRGRTVPGRRRRLRHHGRRVRPGAGGRATTRSSAPSGPESSARARGSGTVPSRWRTPPTSQRRSEAGRCSRSARPRPTRATATAASRITRSRSSTSCLGEIVVAWPDEVATDGWEDACAALPLRHMGRGPDEDPAFFRAAFAAGVIASGMLA